ncbi:MAG: hypothetical protein K0U98_05225 [Deltaproteobacteria bacterium]|nr:hypothetical protein [Deltaproteobacteria bacterium]
MKKKEKVVDIPEVSKPLSQPYVERQLIVVTDDAIVAASRQVAINELQTKNAVNWARIGEFAIQAALGLTGDLITTVAEEAFAAWGRAREIGLEVVPISKSEASSLSFPPGHPRDGVLYIGHPALPDIYHTAAEFHRVTFEHKFSEAILLLTCLGATEINVAHVRGWSRDFSTSLSIPVPTAEVSLQGEVGTTAKTGDSLLFQATLDGAKQPELPGNLVWFHHEPTWQAIAKARLDFGLRDFSLNVSYNDDYGVNAGLKVAVAKTGLDLGGRFEDHVSTEWRISGKFKSASTT